MVPEKQSLGTETDFKAGLWHLLILPLQASFLSSTDLRPSSVKLSHTASTYYACAMCQAWLWGDSTERARGGLCSSKPHTEEATTRLQRDENLSQCHLSAIHVTSLSLHL